MALLAILALAAIAALAASKGSSSSSSTPPADSAPPSNGQTIGGVAYVPVKNTARSASGRVYETWMWPPVASLGGVYTVVRLAGSTAWMAFTYNADTNKSTPAKTNVMQLAMTDGEKSGLLKAFAADWNLPQ